MNVGESGTRNIKRVARESIITDNTLPGDWLFLFFVAQSLLADSLFAETTLPIRRRLWEASPVAGLAELRASNAAGLEALLEAPSVRLIETLDDTLARCWDAEIAATLMLRGSPAPFIARFSEVAASLSAWTKVLDVHRRLDLARSIAKFFVAVVPRLEAPDGDPRTHFTRHLKVGSIRERDEALAPMRRFLDVGLSLLQRRNEFAQCGYGEARYEEAQLFVRAIDDELGPHQDRLRTCAAALSGTVGGFAQSTLGGSLK